MSKTENQSEVKRKIRQKINKILSRLELSSLLTNAVGTLQRYLRKYLDSKGKSR